MPGRPTLLPATVWFARARLLTSRSAIKKFACCSIRGAVASLAAGLPRRHGDERLAKPAADFRAAHGHRGLIDLREGRSATFRQDRVSPAIPEFRLEAFMDGLECDWETVAVRRLPCANSASAPIRCQLPSASWRNSACCPRSMLSRQGQCNNATRPACPSPWLRPNLSRRRRSAAGVRSARQPAD